MDGGEIHLPPGSDAEFLTAYADAVRAGERVAVSEIVTAADADAESDARFPMFVDVDLKTRTRMPPDELLDGARAMQRALAGAYACDPAAFDAWVCTTGGGGASVGLHVYFPRCVVDLARAFVLNRAIRDRADLLSDWRTAIDDSVYGTGLKCIHLRMVGSRKIVPCAACRRRKRERDRDPTTLATTECPDCRNEGKIDVGRVYSLAAVVDGATGRARLEAVDEPLETVLAHTRLRIAQTTPLTEPWTLVDAERAEKEAIETRRAEALRRKGARGAIRFDPEKFDDATEFVADAAEAIVRGVAPKTHGDANVVAVLRSTTGHYCCVYTDSTACANLPNGGRHNTATTYFIVSRTSASQRCRCRCADKTCRDFKGERARIPRELYREITALFEAENDADARALCVPVATAAAAANPAARKRLYGDMARPTGITGAAAALAARLPPPPEPEPDPVNDDAGADGNEPAPASSPAQRLLDMFRGSAYGRFRPAAWSPASATAKKKRKPKAKLGFAPEKKPRRGAKSGGGRNTKRE